jgi:hypothetical protein
MAAAKITAKVATSLELRERRLTVLTITIPNGYAKGHNDARLQSYGPVLSCSNRNAALRQRQGPKAELVLACPLSLRNPRRSKPAVITRRSGRRRSARGVVCRDRRVHTFGR